MPTPFDVLPYKTTDAIRLSTNVRKKLGLVRAPSYPLIEWGGGSRVAGAGGRKSVDKRGHGSNLAVYIGKGLNIM